MGIDAQSAVLLTRQIQQRREDAEASITDAAGCQTDKNRRARNKSTGRGRARGKMGKLGSVAGKFQPVSG